MDKNHSITSPDRNLRLEVGRNIDGRIWYSLYKGDQQVIDKSFLGLFDENDVNIISPQAELESEINTFDETWRQTWGETEFVRNNYSQIKLFTQHFAVYFRLFDDGLGFRYELFGQGDLNIKSERTEFNIDLAAEGWWIPALQSERYEYLYKPHLVRFR